MNHRTVIIAEAGVNHNGSIDLAKKMIRVAALAGADWVKFQTFSANQQVTSKAKKADYQIRATSSRESQYEMLKKLELTSEMHKELIQCCSEYKVGFLSTPFDINSVNLLHSYGQRVFKIPSGEITNLPYLRHIGQLNLEVILSTGMCTMSEVQHALDILEHSGTPRSSITVLHCTTEYPAPIHEVNLLAMQSMRETLGVSVGYSDHTRGIEVSIAAVAMGAKILEKHFTLDRNLDGPDHMASLEPSELNSMIKAIRNIELAMGDGVKLPTESEYKNMLIARKSIVASKFIRAGEIFTAENITVKRPGTGISPIYWDEVLGQIATVDFDVDELIKL